MFRNKLWRDEALFFAVLPDIGFLFILLYVFNSNMNFARAIFYMPEVYLIVYNLFHSFIVLGIVALVVWKLRPRLLPALSGWFIHIIIDIPVHDGTFGTRFLYPILPNVYYSGFTWLDIRVQVVSYIALLIVYVYSVRRERKKHVSGDDWKPDWIDKLHIWGDGLIRRERISGNDEEGNDIGAPPEGLPGEDGEGAVEVDNPSSEEVSSPQDG